MLVMTVGLGHCGSKWVAEMLNRPDKSVRFYHELVAQEIPNWAVWHQYQTAKPLSVFADYFLKLENDLRHYDVVGDSKSWAAYRLPEIDAYFGVERTAYLVRNGIVQLHSLTTKSALWQAPLTACIFNRHLWRYLTLAGVSIDLEPLSKWERTCHLWNTCYTMPPVLSTVTNVRTFKLEDITTRLPSTKALTKYLTNQTFSDLSNWQKRDINRKVVGPRNPENIWATWPKKKRTAFNDICGKGMVHYGYEIFPS